MKQLSQLHIFELSFIKWFEGHVSEYFIWTPDFQMSRSDLTLLRAYQNSGPNNSLLGDMTSCQFTREMNVHEALLIYWLRYTFLSRYGLSYVKMTPRNCIL